MADSLEAFLSRLHHPALASIDLSLDRMHRLLSMLGSPQRRLPPVIHAAGTNGKGSLLAYLQAIFEAAGLRVHKYTSPHLIHFRERIILQGKEIDSRYAETILKHVAPILSSQPATFFEATTAAAFLAFSESRADVLLLETGMGGRLDATNVVEKPLLSVITPVSMDHAEYLGNTITAIAAEKAGILKKDVPCVVGRQVPEAALIIEKKAQEVSAPLYRLGYEWSWQEPGLYQSEKRTLPFIPSLAGKHQYDNAATAIACIDQLPQFSISDAHIARGIANASWPARLQKLTAGPYKDMLPAGAELWLDGGHNPQGGEVLAAWLKEQKKEVYLICGMGKGKDSRAYFAPLAPQVAVLYAVAIPGEPQSQTAGQLADTARSAGMAAEAADSVEKALQSVAGRVKNPAIICICGSLYLAGKVLAAGNR